MFRFVIADKSPVKTPSCITVEMICMVSFCTALVLDFSTATTTEGTVKPAIKPKTAKLTSSSDNVKPSLRGLLVAGCWLLVAGCWLLV